MKVTILGTGSFYVEKDRSGAAYLLEADNKKILIDCGPGTLIRLSQLGIKPTDIDYVFISHFHPDHTSDLFGFQMNFRLNDFFYSEPLKKFPVVYGPVGIKTFTKKLSHLYRLFAFEKWAEIKYENHMPKIQLGKLTVKTFRTKHAPFATPARAFALRFEFEGKAFCFSGDSVIYEAEVKAARNADLFICDTSYAKGKATPAHMDTWEVGEIAEKAGVKKVVLTHFYPNTDSVDLASEVKEKYSGMVERGEDLKRYEV